MIKVLSLYQPYATLMASGAKRIETRSWGTSYRGWVAIHASKNFPQEYRRMLAMQEPFRSLFLKAGYAIGPLKAPEHWIPLGQIVALGNLRACLKIPDHQKFYQLRLGDPNVLKLPPAEPELSLGDYTPGRMAWVFDPVVRLAEPVNLKGWPGLFHLEEAIELQLLRFIPAEGETRVQHPDGRQSGHFGGG